MLIEHKNEIITLILWTEAYLTLRMMNMSKKLVSTDLASKVFDKQCFVERSSVPFYSYTVSILTVSLWLKGINQF